MQPQKREEVSVLEAAQEWARELPSAGYLRRRDFVRWIKYSPEHLKAFLALTALETELPGVKGATQIDLESALSRLSATVATLPTRPKAFPGPRFERTPSRWSSCVRARHIAAVAAAFALLILGVWLINQPTVQSHTDYAELATDIGQRRSFVLPDGTRVQLNTNSVMQMNYSADRRNLTLIGGEAWIRVAGDSHRPFSIQVGSVLIKDVGTEFTVRVEPDEIIVFVIQGRVQLSINRAQAQNERVIWRSDGTSRVESGDIIDLAGSEEAVIRTSGERDPLLHKLHTLSAMEAEKRLAWTTGRLVLTGEPLTDVIREINRYHRQQLVITDTVLENFKVGGTIDPATNDYRVIVRALGSNCPIVIDDSNPAFVRLAIDQVNGACNTRRGGHTVNPN